VKAKIWCVVFCGVMAACWSDCAAYSKHGYAMVNPIDQLAVAKECKRGKLRPLLAVRKAVNHFVYGRPKCRSAGNYLGQWGRDEVGDFNGRWGL